MNRVRFQNLLDSRGSDLAAWPDAERIAAERLIASDPTAAEAFEKAYGLDRLIKQSLASGAKGGDDDEVAFRILARLPNRLPAQAAHGMKRPVEARVIQKEPRPWAFLPVQRALLPRVAALTFAAALGIALGLFWAERMLDHRRATMMASEEGGPDVTSVIFQTNTAIGTF